MLYVQFWAPDDGQKNRLKHVEHFTEINKFRNVAFCWLHCANIVVMHGPTNVKKSVIICLFDLLMTQFTTVILCSVLYCDGLCNNKFVARVNEHVQQEIQIARHTYCKGLGFILQPTASLTAVQILANFGESPVLSCGRWIHKLCCVLGCGVVELCIYCFVQHNALFCYTDN